MKHSILPDFEFLLTSLQKTPTFLNSTDSKLPSSSLYTLNQRFSSEIHISTTTVAQSDFPYINALFFILRTTGIARTTQSAGKTLFEVHQPSLKVWQKLSPKSKELSLLKTLISDLDPKKISAGKISDSIFQHCLEILSSLERNKELNDELSPGLIALLEAFDFINISTKSITQKGYETIEALENKTDVKLANLANCFLNEEELFQSYLNKELEAKSESLFQRLETPKHDGSYQVSISLRDHQAKATITVPAQFSFAELCNAILDLYSFEDRLPIYSFAISNPFGEIQKISHYYAIFYDAELDSRDYTLGQFGLNEGQVIPFHFDFNKNWLFDLTIDKISNETFDEVQVLKKPLDPPKQENEVTL